MVRIRKNVKNLTVPQERTRLVEALTKLNAKKGYGPLQDMHRVGVAFGPRDPFLHKNSAFLPWHRAAILHLERALQEINPAVTVPYWDSDDAIPATLFTQAFIGELDLATCENTPANLKQCQSGGDGGKECDVTNPATDCIGVGNPRACCTGPGAGAACKTCAGGATCAFQQWCKLKGAFKEADWNFKVGTEDVPVRRLKHAFTGTPTTAAWSGTNSGPFKIAPAANAIGQGSYKDMRPILEFPIHNAIHRWAGGVNDNMQRTVIDPLFFLYHCNHDRIWAKWQADKPAHRGFATDVAYTPKAGTAFDPTKPLSRMAYADGSLWPWNNLTDPLGDCTNTGCGTTPTPCCSNVTSRHCTVVASPSGQCDKFPTGWPPTADGGAAGFPQAPGGKLGPPKVPLTKDVIDYEGRANPTKGLGFAYEDTPY
jgi:hypothetical protein